VERFVELRAEAAVLYTEENGLESAECAKEGLRLIESCPLTGWMLRTLPCCVFYTNSAKVGRKGQPSWKIPRP